MPKFTKDYQPGAATRFGAKRPPAPTAAEDTSMRPKVTEDQPLYYARFVIPGTGRLTLFGVDYDQGEIFVLLAGPKNSKLIDQGHIEQLQPGSDHLYAQCGACERWFISEYRRDEHGKRRHGARFADEDLEVAEGMLAHHGAAAVRDTTGDAEERRLLAEAPLHLENTSAARRA
jgi:hypothetical protein